jgi:hypothetical protein
VSAVGLEEDPFEKFSMQEGEFAKEADAALFKALVHVSAQAAVSLSATDIQQLEAARASAVALVRKHFDNMIYAANKRRANLLTQRSFNVVSLGYDCFPRTLLSRWGIKKTARLGELSMPFDLAIHPSGAMAHLLETNFASYFDGSMTFDAAKDFPIHRELGIEFNHEIGKQFSANQMAEVKERYRKRVENFEAIIADDMPAAFVHHAETPDPHSVERIFQNIRDRRSGKNSIFILLYTPPFGQELADFAAIKAMGVSVITQPYPFKGYVWYRKTHTYSRRGFQFERDLAENLNAALVKFQV